MESSTLLTTEEDTDDRPVASSSARLRQPTTPTPNVPENRDETQEEIDTGLTAAAIQRQYASEIVSIIDMVWTSLEVFLILMAVLPGGTIPWYVTVACLTPNLIQFAGAILMYRRTRQGNDTAKMYRCCQIWLFLAFVTIALHGAFITWTTVTGVITKFLSFVVLVKLFWRFTTIFFINEFHNELESSIIRACYTRISDRDDDND